MLRRGKGLTQRQLADRVGVTDKAVSKWERGLSMPDVSILEKLAVILDSDVSSIIRESGPGSCGRWRGMLVLPGPCEAGTLVYDKPLVDIQLCYFALAGIDRVLVLCGASDMPYMEDRAILLARQGMRVECSFHGSAESQRAVRGLSDSSNVFCISSPQFLYGSNLTMKFRRAMARGSGVTVLAAYDDTRQPDRISFDCDQRLTGAGSAAVPDCPANSVVLPMAFCSKGSLESYVKLPLASLTRKKVAYVEFLRRGVVKFDLKDEDAVLDASLFVRMMRRHCDGAMYDLEEILRRSAASNAGPRVCGGVDAGAASPLKGEGGKR